jgi:hypothetical protein
VGILCTRTTRNRAQAVWWKGERETGRHKLVHCPWYLSVRILFLLSHNTHTTHIISCTAYLCTKTRLFQIPIQHVSRHLHVATMILESERGFNYTLTRDKLAMNLGSPPRRVKNVTPASQPASAPATQTKATTTTTRFPKPPTDTTPFPPFESPEIERYELSAESDYRVATLEAQVASLTNKGAEAGEFGCYPCLCDTLRCVCICTSLLIVLPSLPSLCLTISNSHSRPSRRVRRRDPQPQSQPEPS